MIICRGKEGLYKMKIGQKATPHLQALSILHSQLFISFAIDKGAALTIAPGLPHGSSRKIFSKAIALRRHAEVLARGCD